MEIHKKKRKDPETLYPVADLEICVIGGAHQLIFINKFTFFLQLNSSKLQRSSLIRKLVTFFDRVQMRTPEVSNECYLQLASN